MTCPYAGEIREIVNKADFPIPTMPCVFVEKDAPPTTCGMCEQVRVRVRRGDSWDEIHAFVRGDADE